MCIINLCLFRKIKLMELTYYSTPNFLIIGEYFFSFCWFGNWMINFQIDKN